MLITVVWCGVCTELKVGVVGADVVTGTQQPLHHQSCTHGIVQTKVLGDATLLHTHTHTRPMSTTGLTFGTCKLKLNFFPPQVFSPVPNVL